MPIIQNYLILQVRNQQPQNKAHNFHNFHKVTLQNFGFAGLLVKKSGMIILGTFSK